MLKEGKNINFASTYESEVSFVDFINFINNKNDDLSQLAFVKNDKFYEIKKRKNPNGEHIDIIPDFGDLELDKLTNLGEIGTFRYWRPKNSKGSAVLANKGCRARCSFCSVRNFNGKGVRQKPTQTVIDEIKSLQDNYGINHITWLDDLLYDVNRTLELFNGIVKQNLKLLGTI